MAPESIKVSVSVDSQPLLAFTEHIYAAIKRRGLLIELPTDLSELIRVEGMYYTTSANKLGVTLQPSELFLRLCAAAIAGEGDLGVVS